MTWTGLHDACEHQDTEAVLKLVQTNSDQAVNVDEHGETPLHIACWANPPLKIVEALIAAFPQAVTDQDVHGDTPLHVALMNPDSNCEVVHALLKACPTVASVANKEGLYPLHVSCRHCPDEKVIDVLLEEYPYALRHAIKCGEPAPKKTATLGTKKATDHVPLEGDRNLSNTMVERRFQAAEKQIRDGAYPLHMAIASKASKNVIEMLMSEAPDVLQMTNKYGETPLHVALSCDAETETVELLLHMKEDTDAVKKAEKRHGNLPLHLAAIRGCSDGVALLLLTEYPEAAAVANTEGKTPLDLALEVGHCSDDFLHLLEKYGVSE